MHNPPNSLPPYKGVGSFFEVGGLKYTPVANVEGRASPKKADERGGGGGGGGTPTLFFPKRHQRQLSG